MTNRSDHIEILGAEIRVRKQRCGTSLKEANGTLHIGALFEDIESAELRSKVNEAMHVAVAHYTEALARAGAELTPWQIMVLSFRVVIYILFRKDMARQASNQPRSLAIQRADLRNAAAKNLCWVYCESTFPTDYARRVAALTETSLDEFKKYEQNRRPLMQDMGMLR